MGCNYIIPGHRDASPDLFGVMGHSFIEWLAFLREFEKVQYVDTCQEEYQWGNVYRIFVKEHKGIMQKKRVKFYRG